MPEVKYRKGQAGGSGRDAEAPIFRGLRREVACGAVSGGALDQDVGQALGGGLFLDLLDHGDFPGEALEGRLV